MSRRDSIKNVVISSVNLYSEIIKLYGSFSHDAFHLSKDNMRSYSDIDIYCKNPLTDKDRYQLSKNICERILLNTGISFRVSVRKSRIHDFTMSANQNIFVTTFETLLKTYNNPSIEHAVYQSVRYILRTKCSKQYYDSPFNPNNLMLSGISYKLALLLYEVKRGVREYNSWNNFLEDIKPLLIQDKSLIFKIDLFRRYDRYQLELLTAKELSSSILINKEELREDITEKYNSTFKKGMSVSINYTQHFV